MKRGAPSTFSLPPISRIRQYKYGNHGSQGKQRNRGCEAKHGTMVTMTMATKVAEVTKVALPTKINNHTSFYDPIASDATVDPSPQVSFSILLLPMVGNSKVRF
jgi:hypothetical protein